MIEESILHITHQQKGDLQAENNSSFLQEQEGGGMGFKDHRVGLGDLGALITTNHQAKV